MNSNNNSIVSVGILHKKITDKLNIKLSNEEIYIYPGLEKHIKKRHPDCIKYIVNISDIINNPDYIGVNPNVPDSVELVKCFDKNILLSIKLSTDTEKDYLYVSSLYDISQAKTNNRINSGRLNEFI